MAVTDFPNQAFEQPESEPSTDSAVSVRDRLVPPMPGGAMWGWIGPLLVTVFGAFLRFVNLGRPNAVMFDETYYAKDAWSLVNFLAERTMVKDADKVLMAGGTEIWQKCAPAEIDKCASYVVH
ncbi:phospholipid carrier-dependent glycosyltransferase, partial [Streptosporangium sp. NPDC020072]